MFLCRNTQGNSCTKHLRHRNLGNIDLELPSIPEHKIDRLWETHIHLPWYSSSSHPASKFCSPAKRCDYRARLLGSSSLFSIGSLSHVPERKQARIRRTDRGKKHQIQTTVLFLFSFSYTVSPFLRKAKHSPLSKQTAFPFSKIRSSPFSQ